LGFPGRQRAYARFVASLAEPTELAFGALGQVPTDMLQTLFFLADPQLAMRKFSRFAGLDPASPEALNFVATEDWLNDGVPLALPTARECFGGWYGAESAGRRQLVRRRTTGATGAVRPPDPGDRARHATGWCPRHRPDRWPP
jgi:hypothetical protein